LRSHPGKATTVRYPIQLLPYALAPKNMQILISGDRNMAFNADIHW
jgi:hypothetical protein